jgi:hypothetical protein
MSIVDSIVREVLAVLEDCDFRPTDAERIIIDTHMSVLNEEESEEVDMMISAKVLMSRAQSTVG